MKPTYSDWPAPYLLFLGDVADEPHAKTAFGLRDWAPERCIGEHALPETSVTTGLPRLSPAEAYARGARALVVGVAPAGGVIPVSWVTSLLSALEAGLDIVSGMHTALASIEELRIAAERLGRRLIDVRKPRQSFLVATGRKRSGKRLLTVGTDCALGKKYTALALTDAFKRRGIDAEFRATGQTGILIAGGGIPLDAVVADFAAGAAEALTPDAAPEHWDIVEGQGSLFHPSYAGVTLALLHGTQPDIVVVCHQPGRETVLGLPHFALPGLEEAIDLNLRLARRTNPDARCGGISLNTQSMPESEARAMMAAEASRLGIPCADPLRGGLEFKELTEWCLKP